VLVAEYLSRKYEVDFPTTITYAEAKVLGIPYPLEPKWIAEHGAKEITVLDAMTLRSALINRLDRVGPGNKCVRFTVRGIAVLDRFISGGE
jgi:hypothetical protein